MTYFDLWLVARVHRGRCVLDRVVLMSQHSVSGVWLRTTNDTIRLWSSSYNLAAITDTICEGISVTPARVNLLLCF